MTFVLALFVGGTFGWLIRLFLLAWEKGVLRAKWLDRKSVLQRESPLLAWNRPLIALLAPLFKKPLFEKVIGRTRKFFALLHAEKHFAPEAFLSWTVLLWIEGGLGLCALFGCSLRIFLAGGCAGAFYPPARFFLEKKKRLEAIRRDLPLLMDLLALLVSAGLDMMQAIQKICTVLPAAPLLEEMERMLGDLKLGHTRKEALLLLRGRLGLPELRQFLSLLLGTLELGSPLSPVLLAGAEQMRQTRFARAEKLGIQASQKILVPLVLCILPAVFLTIFVPLFLRFYFGGIDAWL